MVYTAVLLTAIVWNGNALSPAVGADDPVSRLDAIFASYWQSAGMHPAALSGDSTFLRRVTLDLAGRIPTYLEAVAFAADPSPDKRQRAIQRLMAGPEYPLHLGNVLDELIQGKYAGDRDFIGYLRQSVASRKPWDTMFREIMLGPWDSDERKPAARFLSRRIRDLDDMTTDTSRVFFGIEIACAKCHDHPLVSDWTQHHYYGMASFFNRTYEFGKERIVGEKDSDDVTFVDQAGIQNTARPMFLSGRVMDEPLVVIDPKLKDLKERRQKEGRYLEPAFSRREMFVAAALDQKEFFRRAIVNQMWSYLLGRGIVHPVDQMHSENPPSVSGVLELLADDFSLNGYDLDRLIYQIASSRVYQLSSGWESASEVPAVEHFAVAQLRPLTPRQYAFSVMLAAGDGSFDQSEPGGRLESYRAIEGRAASLTESLDQRTANFQSSATEALFMSNNPAVQRLVAPDGKNLASRLAVISDTRSVIDTAFWTVLGRAPAGDERLHLEQWFESHQQDRPDACMQLVWALVTSAEFRFNY